jgi:hypothetical protein
MKIEWGDEALGITTGRIPGTNIEVDIGPSRIRWHSIGAAVYLCDETQKPGVLGAQYIGYIKSPDGSHLTDEEITERALALAVTHELEGR